MFKQGKNQRKEFDMLDLNIKKRFIDIDINQHKNGKLNLRHIPKGKALELLELKGYI